MKVKISIIVPVYNEERTIDEVIKKIARKDFGLEKEIIVVNDGSVDSTREVLGRLNEKNVRIINYSKNKGKGYVVRKGIKEAKGEIIAIQDADLEYNLDDLKNLIGILIKENFKVIYGSRFLEKNKHYKINSFYIANRLLSLLTSILYFRKITDMETCYKVFRKEALKEIKLNSKGFEFEPEITAKFIKKGYKIKEIPISYKPRSKEEGKKIKWKDGVIAAYTLLRNRFSPQSQIPQFSRLLH
jgi:dolichol-phosphate mannosyltransferase